MAKLIIKMVEQGDTNFVTVHSTPDGDPFLTKKDQVVGRFIRQ